MKHVHPLAALVCAFVLTAPAASAMVLAQDGQGASAPADAAAVAYFPPPMLVNASDGNLATKGALLISSSDGGVPVVTVTDAGGTALAGVLVMRGGYYVWTPAQELTAGATYQVTLAGGTNNFGNGGPTVVTLTARATDLTQPLAFTAKPTVTTLDVDDQRCCTRWPLGTGSNPCFALSRTTSARVTPMLETSAPLAERDQFLYAIVPSGSTDPVAFAPWGYSTELSFTEDETEHCFEVQAMSLATGDVQSFDDFDGHCVAHGTLPKPGTVTFDPVAGGKLARDVCGIPTADLMSSWCHVNEDPCEAKRSASGCETYGNVCHGEALPGIDGGVAGTASFGGAGTGGSGAGTYGGAGTGGDLHDDHGAQRSDGGCSVAPARGTGSHGAPAWVSSSLLVLFARARRRRVR